MTIVASPPLRGVFDLQTTTSPLGVLSGAPPLKAPNLWVDLSTGLCLGRLKAKSLPSYNPTNPLFMKEKTPNTTKKLSVILDAKLHNQAKRYALLNDMTLTELVISLLQERLEQDSSSKRGHQA